MKSSYRGAPTIDVQFYMPNGEVYALDGQDGRPASVDLVESVQWEMILGSGYMGQVSFVDVHGVLERVYFYAAGGGKGAVKITVYWSEDGVTRSVHLYGVVLRVEYTLSADTLILTMHFSGNVSSHLSAKADVDVGGAYQYSPTEVKLPHEVFKEFAEKYGWVTEVGGVSTIYVDPRARTVTKPLSYSAKSTGADETRPSPAEYMAQQCSGGKNPFVTGDMRPYTYRNEPSRDGSGVVHFFHPVDWTPGSSAVEDGKSKEDTSVVISAVYEYRANDSDVIDVSVESQWLSLAYFSGANADFVHLDSVSGERVSTHALDVTYGVVAKAESGQSDVTVAPRTQVSVSARDANDAAAKIAASPTFKIASPMRSR
jgi:hypothetical protein